MSPVVKAARSGLRGVLGAGEPPIAPRARLIGGLVALVAAAMAFMAVAATEAGLGADRIAGEWSSALSEVATVRVSAQVKGRSGEVDDQARRAAAAVDVLETAPGVVAARILTEDENRALLAPWLGPEADVAALPLPALIDVTLEDGGSDAADIQRRLDVAAPGAVYDDHRAWRAPLIEAAGGLRRFAAIGVLLSLLALAAMVALAAGATLWSGAGVVRTLRLIGAEDRFISRAFERPFALRAGIGAALGALAALILAARLPAIEGLETVMGEAPGGGLAWRLLLVAPPVAALTALVATRAAVHYVLRRE